MPKKLIRIATRQSPLALWQAHYVQQRLLELHNGMEVQLVPLVTKGDVWLDKPLSKIGGKGLFVKELELAILQNRADIAVHSMKDVPVFFPKGLRLMAICQREDPRDAFVSDKYSDLAQLPPGSVVGTSSLRRQCQIASLRPDLEIRSLRGNVGTRLAKLDNGDYDAIVLAAAGLKRLQLETRIASYLEPETLLPAVGQGAIGVECRDDNVRVRDWLTPLNHSMTALCVQAEREVNNRLQGGCQVPLASYACFSEGELWLRALVGTPNGKRIIRGELRGAPEYARKIGIALADELLQKGAGEVLAQAKQNPPDHDDESV